MKVNDIDACPCFIATPLHTAPALAEFSSRAILEKYLCLST